MTACPTASTHTGDTRCGSVAVARSHAAHPPDRRDLRCVACNPVNVPALELRRAGGGPGAAAVPCDKLAQLLVVGVRCCGRPPCHQLPRRRSSFGRRHRPDDFYALAEIVAGVGSATLAVSVDEEGGGCPG